MLGGIGISHSDVPALLWKLRSHKIADLNEIYETICGCRHIDLTTVTFCQFAFNTGYFSYPKSKAHLYQKYLAGQKMESGKSVWDAYDSREFEAIEARNLGEVSDAVAIYKLMVEQKKRADSNLKRLARREKAELKKSENGT